MLPIFWLDDGANPLEVPGSDCCDSRQRAEISDFTADKCINAELSKS